MSKSSRVATCPSCSREFEVGSSVNLDKLVCAYCEEEMGRSALQGAEALAAEIAPGFHPGQKLGNYVIESLLGSGGMAVVFRGIQLSLNRTVAIKVLPEKHVKKKTFLDRFESEAAALATLNHPNVVSVIDRGYEQNTYFIVMEYIDGKALQQLLADECSLKPEEIYPIAEQTLSGLEYAHKQGVVHRDIKPGNILRTADGVVKIADFGLAHLAKAQGGMDITRDNQSMGTIKYMAPEQLMSAKNVDGRADLYSFGVCLYEMLTGRLPLGTFKMPSEENPDLDARWDDVILKVLRMDPEERYDTAAQMAAVIHEIATTPLVSGRQREQQEQGRMIIAAGLSPLACEKCDHESPPKATKCERCGTSLADLFDKCPHCRRGNRVDISPCPGCGADLKALRIRLRRKAERIQRKALELARNKEFDAAIVQLGKLIRFKSREYAPVRSSAAECIRRFEKQKEKFQERSYEAGARMIAEKRFEKALQLWEPLESDYRDVRVRRRAVRGQMDDARAALELVEQLYGRGKYSSAIRSLERAREFWPHDKDLYNKVVEARIKLGNQNIKARYFEDAKIAKDKGNLEEARSLCRRALALDPNDAGTLVLVQALDKTSAVDSNVSDIPLFDRGLAPVPMRKKSQEVNKAAVAAVLGALALVLALAILFFVVLPDRTASRERNATNLLSMAENAKSAGNLSKAKTHAAEVLSEYPNSQAAPDARELIASIQEMLGSSREELNKADRILQNIDRDSLIQGFRIYEQLVNNTTIKAVASAHDYARERLEDVRRSIALDFAREARVHEQNNAWRNALAVYKRAEEEFYFTLDPIASGIKQAQARVQQCEQLMKQAQATHDEQAWEKCAGLCRSALDVIHNDPEAEALLAKIGAKLTPPEGMVYVPAGEYQVGGAEGNPERVASFPHGFFIDRIEITRARYAEFVRATGNPAPPGWPEEGQPPPGTEDLPVVRVTWEDATAFAEWAGNSLPTEAQWEAAAGAADGMPYPWGAEWENGAVLGFAPTVGGSAKRDQSPFGCMDMVGNVAEWTATTEQVDDDIERISLPLPAPRPTQRRPKITVHIVKGSSWAGLEAGRPTRVVPGPEPPQEDRGNRDSHQVPDNVREVKQPPVKQVLKILTSDPKHAEVVVAFAATMRIFYVGARPSTAHARLHVRQWMPQWGTWVEAQFSLKVLDNPEAAVRYTSYIKFASRRPPESTPEEDKPERHKVQFDTRCVIVAHEPDQYLIIRNKFGVERRLELQTMKVTREVRRGNAEKTHPLSKQPLSDAARRPVRMLGRHGQAYLNVGFRTVRRLWSPPPPRLPSAIPTRSP